MKRFLPKPNQHNTALVEKKLSKEELAKLTDDLLSATSESNGLLVDDIINCTPLSKCLDNGVQFILQVWRKTKNSHGQQIICWNIT